MWVFLRRVSPPLLLLCVCACTPGRHAVRLRAADGHVQTTVPRPRPPLVLADGQVHQALQVLAHKVVPMADPLELARQRFEVPLRGGVYVFNLRTKQIQPLDDAAAAREDLPPELMEQARGYLQWCGNIHKRGDCLQVLRNGGILDAHGRYAVAMAIAQGSTIEATKASLKEMVDPDAVMAMLVSGMTMYMMLWVLPEPVTKGIAAAMTIVLVAYVGVDTLYTLGRGWKTLVDAADKATTFEQLRDAGEELAKVMGADTARILVMLAAAAVGSEAAGMAKIAPSLPGAAQASRLAVAEGSVALELVGAVETVTIAESGLTISLAPGAVAMSSTTSPGGRSIQVQSSKADLKRYDGPKPRYHVNEAHNPGSPDFDSRKTPVPPDAEEVYQQAVPSDPTDPGHWYGMNSKGEIYRFSDANDGTAHFSGRENYGDGLRKIPPYVLRRLGRK